MIASVPLECFIQHSEVTVSSLDRKPQWSRDPPRYRVRDPSLMKRGSALEAGKRGFLKIPSHSRPPTALAGLEDLLAKSSLRFDPIIIGPGVSAFTASTISAASA
jgi:hypothetical protein